MPGSRENLPDEIQWNSDTLDISSEDIWNSLDEFFEVEDAQPGDITLNDIIDHYGISRETARRKINYLIGLKKFKRLKVMINGSLSIVYRKIQ